MDGVRVSIKPRNDHHGPLCLAAMAEQLPNGAQTFGYLRVNGGRLPGLIPPRATGAPQHGLRKTRRPKPGVTHTFGGATLMAQLLLVLTVSPGNFNRPGGKT